jgi:ornithine decarboxylase
MNTVLEQYVDSSFLHKSIGLLGLDSNNNSDALPGVPRTVVDKFDVVTVDKSIEQLIADKLVEEDAIDTEEAFYFIDLGCVVKKYRQWIHYLPRVKPYYALKCNPNNAITRTLASLGVNFDCASKAEIQQILGSGVSANRIIYANPTKMKSHISYAKSSGVKHMTFDNEDELRKIAEVYPEASLVLRIITDDSNSVCRFSTKFGAPMHQVSRLLTLAKELNLNLVGVSFHVGSGCMSVLSFEAAIRSARTVFDMSEAIGMPLTMLDIGGGWPGNDYDAAVSFPEIADHIRPILDELFPSNVDIIAEPGRYFVAESHTLAVNVFAKREVPATADESKRFLYYVNDGVYQSFNCIFFDHVHPTPLVHDLKSRREMVKCTIFGPTCDSMDCIAKDIYLPELEVGEWLYFKNMGAYTTAAASPFNGFKSHPNTFYIQSPIPTSF